MAKVMMRGRGARVMRVRINNIKQSLTWGEEAGLACRATAAAPAATTRDAQAEECMCGGEVWAAVGQVW